MKKGDVRDFDSLEEYYNKVRKIKFADDVQIESLNDIYKNLFTTDRRYEMVQKPTYFVRGAQQCNAGRYRSIDDFLKISKRYFPEKTLKELFQFLKDKQEELLKDGLMQGLSYCAHIRKYNFKGLSGSRYCTPIERYRLNDLNPNVEGLVADILT